MCWNVYIKENKVIRADNPKGWKQALKIKNLAIIKPLGGEPGRTLKAAIKTLYSQ